MGIFEDLLTSVLSMGLSDLIAVFVFLFVLKLEIKIVIKIIGAVIALEVLGLILSGLPLSELAGLLLFGV